jgi:hypothetical protein
MPCGGVGVPPAVAQGKGASQTPPPAEAGRKSHDVPFPNVGALAPRAGGGAASPGDSTDQPLCGEAGIPRGERARKESLTYEQCA